MGVMLNLTEVQYNMLRAQYQEKIENLENRTKKLATLIGDLTEKSLPFEAIKVSLNRENYQMEKLEVYIGEKYAMQTLSDAVTQSLRELLSQSQLELHALELERSDFVKSYTDYKV